jgi:hypothetical protein
VIRAGAAFFKAFEPDLDHAILQGMKGNDANSAARLQTGWEAVQKLFEVKKLLIDLYAQSLKNPCRRMNALLSGCCGNRADNYLPKLAACGQGSLLPLPHNGVSYPAGISLLAVIAENLQKLGNRRAIHNVPGSGAAIRPIHPHAKGLIRLE